MDVLVLNSTFVKVSRTVHSDGLTLPHLLESNIPTLGDLVVTQLEYLRLSQELFGVLHLLAIQVTSPVDGHKVVLLAPPLVLRFLCFLNFDAMVVIRDSLCTIAHVIVVFIETDTWMLKWILFI